MGLGSQMQLQCTFRDTTAYLSWDVVHMLQLHLAPTASPLSPDINSASYGSMSKGYLHIIYTPLFSSLVFNTKILSKQSPHFPLSVAALEITHHREKSLSLTYPWVRRTGIFHCGFCKMNSELSAMTPCSGEFNTGAGVRALLQTALQNHFTLCSYKP